MSYSPKTPDEHHSTLVNAILYEIKHYGPDSLLEVTATLLEDLEPAGVKDGQNATCDRYASKLRQLTS